MSPQLQEVLLRFADDNDLIGYCSEDTTFQEVEDEYHELLKVFKIG
jgi:hypothetical protein